MATLNLALQNCPLSRNEQGESIEKRLRTSNSMEAIRKQQAVVQDGRAASVRNVQKAIDRRFKQFAEQQVMVHEPASAKDVSKFFQRTSQVDSSIEISNCASPAIRSEDEGATCIVSEHALLPASVQLSDNEVW